jgi:GH35 family endo-1,4-beta-xylanase
MRNPQKLLEPTDSNQIGPEFIPIAFMTAAQYDPTVKLYYNDYNLEYGSAKAMPPKTSSRVSRLVVSKSTASVSKPT